MSKFDQPNWNLNRLIKQLDSDIEEYTDAVNPLFDLEVKLAHPAIPTFLAKAGGHSGVLSYYQQQLKEIAKRTSGSKLRRIIRIIFE